MKTSVLCKPEILPLCAGLLLAGQVAADIKLAPGNAGDTTADVVFGQLDFVFGTKNFIDKSGLNSAAGGRGDIAIDKSVSPNRVYVADRNNNRVLGWNGIAAFAKHSSATIVIGQPTMSSNICNNGSSLASAASPRADSLCSPAGVAVDSSGNLYVADQGNHRVLEFHTPQAITAVAGSGDTTADTVFGQFGSFSSNNCNSICIGPNSLCAPTGLSLDGSGNLYVADSSNSRVLQYKPSGLPAVLKSAQAAGGVLGQPLLTTSFVDFLDARGLNLQDAAEGGIAIDYSVTPNRIYVADRNNNRVLAWNDIAAFKRHEPAARVFGQPNAFSNLANNGGISEAALNQPRALAVDAGGNLYISDFANNRVLTYNTPFIDTTADAVYGQGNRFNTSSCKTLGPDSLCVPDGIAIDAADNLYVADTTSNRVLEYLKP